MQVRPEDVPIDRAFAYVLAVVAEPGDNAAERLNAVAQKGPPSVVLEADDSRSVPFDDDVPDEALRLGAGVDRVQIQDLGAGELLTFGADLEVLDPPELRERIASAAAEVVDLYGVRASR